VIDVLVTGADGFIGAELVARLRQEGRQVLALGRGAGDIADPALWRALPPAREVMHLAARSYVPDSWQDSLDFMRVNVMGTEVAIDYCRRHGAALVFASAYIYGIPTHLPISEADPVRPNNPYALSKFLAEQLCEFAATYHGVPVTVLRLFNVFGAGQREDFLIPTVMRQVKAAEEIRVLNLEPRRDYVYIDDVVAALCASRKGIGFRRFNIGSGVSLSVRDVVETIQFVAGTRLSVNEATQVRPNEIPDMRANIAAAADALKWQPEYSFAQGVERMLTQAAAQTK
jgi:nucleoside-diphosphate-sugar epimerase